jgi:hypothetical protein
MARWLWLPWAALAASAISSVATPQAQAQNERSVSLDEIPAPARDAILSQLRGGELGGVVEETRQGEPTYRAGIRHGPRRLMIVVDAAGNVLSARYN